MSGPIVFISHNAVKEGKLEGFRDAFVEVAEALEAEKPGTVVFLAFADEDGSEVSVVHVFPDADAMGRHLEGVQERMGTAVEFIRTTGYEIYGAPSEPVLDAMRGFVTSEGVALRVQTDHIGGYLRLGT
ncbi:MAG TPA: antibiotic biosynthesis monooxygenase [Actinomycetota bacterium]|nr:antibiotic biosynthesis monooxygenase [Actinomycetota bacterium]